MNITNSQKSGGFNSMKTYYLEEAQDLASIRKNVNSYKKIKASNIVEAIHKAEELREHNITSLVIFYSKNEGQFLQYE